MTRLMTTSHRINQMPCPPAVLAETSVASCPCHLWVVWFVRRMTRHERERNTHGQGWPADRFEANRGRLGPSARQVGPGDHLHVH